MAQETAFWRRAVWEKIGGLDESFQYAMDYEYYQRMLASGYHFVLLPHYMGAFRKHDESKGATLEHIYQRELEILYSKYGIAASYEEALAQLDARLSKQWRLKHLIIKELCHQRISDNPRHMLLIFRLLHTAIVSEALLSLYRIYRRNKVGAV